jgi:nucleoside 2-deoxyribosyltransferase
MIKIYLTTRLFNFDDKLRTCKLERYLKDNFDVSIYMPYRDSDEENISKENWKKEIFDIDIKEINNCDILIGYLDGPEFDEGVGFEIGYAITQNKQVVIINSDFVNYRYNTIQSQEIDPLLNYLNIKILKPTSHRVDNDFCNSLEELSQELLNQVNLNINKNTINLTEIIIFENHRHSHCTGFLIHDFYIQRNLLTHNGFPAGFIGSFHHLMYF